MATGSQIDYGSHPGALQLKRLELVMDVVFAILIWRIITLLPTPTEEHIELNSIASFLGDTRHDYLIIFIGLFLVVVYWLQNNSIFGKLAGTDGRFVFQPGNTQGGPVHVYPEIVVILCPSAAGIGIN